MGYHISDRVRRPTAAPPEKSPSQEDARLEFLLEHGTDPERRRALCQLVNRRAEATLMRCLASDRPDTARLAADGLRECWHGEKGPLARAEMAAGVAAMNEGDLSGAAAIFDGLMKEFPDWAEAFNKQATLLYLQGSPEESIAPCRDAVKRKPGHFGAWNGMALGAIQVEHWPLALEAVRHALRLQPRSGYHRQLLQLVESRLPSA